MDYSVMGFMKYVRKKTFNRDIFSYAHFKCKKVSISCLGDTYFLFNVQLIIFLPCVLLSTFLGKEKQ